MDTEGQGDTGDADEWPPVRLQLLRNDVDVALAVLREAQRREEALSAALDGLAACLLAERCGEADAAETDRRLSGIRASLKWHDSRNNMGPTTPVGKEQK